MNSNIDFYTPLQKRGIKKGFSAMPMQAKLIFLAIIVVVFLLLRSVLSKIFGGLSNGFTNMFTGLGRGLKDSPTSDVGFSDDDGQINLQTAAETIYQALRGSWWSEDEATAMQTLMKVPKDRVKNVALIYSSIDGKARNMYSDFSKYLSSSQYNVVKEWLGG